ncbi:MFS transporter [Gordonia rubripertincta]|uniref:Major facilitator superfamily transporter n=1 Tax=Gordonia rubripertincta NBRC 101908 TaxID=1077975 RepID=A0ABQ0HQK9_GORRU|nr:MFS transporter [Gordonia rubripertincta]GAB84555.1 putative major facilitator superfamily transporter [Gordonia rubripertincta NBRC 101908]
MKRTFSFGPGHETLVIVTGIAFIAATYGLVRLAYGLFLPDIQTDLALDSAGAGYISTGSSLVYCLAALCGFFLGRQFPRMLIIVATATAAGGVWGMAAATHLVIFGLSAVIASVGAGLASPAMVSVVRRNIAAKRVDRGQSMVNSGTGPGLVGAGLLALLFLPGWRLTWVVIGVITVLISAALLTADRPDPAERDEHAKALSADWVRRHRTALTVAVLLGVASSAMWTYGRVILVDTGGSSQRGTIVAWIMIGIGGAAVALTATPLARWSATSAWTLSCGTMTVGILVVAAVPGQLIVSLVGCLLFGWGFTSSTSALIAWTSTIDAARSAAGTALLFIASMFGQAVGATALGAIITAASYGAAFVVAAAVATMSIVVSTLDRTDRRADAVAADASVDSVRAPSLEPGQQLSAGPAPAEREAGELGARQCH